MARDKRPPGGVRVTFGARVRQERKAANMTLEDLAERADMNWSYIAQVERGERNIGIDNMMAIAEGLGIPLRDLL